MDMTDKRIRISCLVAIVGVIAYIGFQFVWLDKIYKSEEEVFRRRLKEVFQWALLDASLPKIGAADNYPNYFGYNMATKVMTIVKDGVRHDFSSSGSDIPFQFARAAYDIQKVKSFDINKLDSSFQKELKKKKLLTSVEFKYMDIENSKMLAHLPSLDTEIKRPLTDTLALGYLSKDVIIARYNYPKEMFLYKISSVLLTDFLLITILIVSIYFQIRTIISLRKDAVEREYLTRTMVHELKRPLNFVKAVLEMSHTADMPPPSPETLECADRRLGEMRITVDRILTGMTESPRKIREKETFNLSESIASLTDRYNFVLKSEERVRFRGNNWIKLHADRTELLNAIGNLIDNGLKYSDEKSEVKVYCYRRKNEVLVTVEDRGCGIPVHERKAIFKKYYRGREHRSESSVQGFGLGLSYVASVIRAHHGKIAVKSKPGKGSKFIIRLPGIP